MGSAELSMPNGHSHEHALNNCHTSSASTDETEHRLMMRSTILHLGDAIRYNTKLEARLRSQFHIIRPSPSDLHRGAFIQHLKDRTWGNFSAIMKPFWSTGGEMGRWDEELIELLPPSMRVMASAGAGFDWVKTDLLAERGIVYCNGLGASTESVAEMAIYLIISVFRHMSWSALAARSGDPASFQEAHVQVPLASRTLRGHTLGIVGLGNIGFAIAQKAKLGFGMRIAYHDINRKTRKTEEEIDAEYFDSLESLLPVSDCLLLATPWGPPILTHSTLALLPRGSRIVNIARGSLIDETALADALDLGHVSAAGLDVHADEPHVNRRLAAMRNVTMTPHTGGGSVNTMIGFESLAMENVQAVLNGREALTPVNLGLMRTRGDGVNGAAGYGQDEIKEVEHEKMDKGLVNGLMAH